MTSNEITPIAPPGIGDVIADPGAWQGWALDGALLAATDLSAPDRAEASTPSVRVSRVSWVARVVSWGAQ